MPTSCYVKHRHGIFLLATEQHSLLWLMNCTFDARATSQSDRSHESQMSACWAKRQWQFCWTQHLTGNLRNASWVFPKTNSNDQILAPVRNAEQKTVTFLGNLLAIFKPKITFHLFVYLWFSNYVRTSIVITYITTFGACSLLNPFIHNISWLNRLYSLRFSGSNTLLSN
jgi:hypothetical protein